MTIGTYRLILTKSTCEDGEQMILWLLLIIFEIIYEAIEDGRS